MVEPHEKQRLLLARANQVDSGTGCRLPLDVLDLCLEYGNIPLWQTGQIILVDVPRVFTEQRRTSLREWCGAEIDSTGKNRQLLFLNTKSSAPKQIRATLRRDRKQQQQQRYANTGEAAVHVVMVVIQRCPNDHTWKWMQERVHAKAMTVVYIGCLYSLFDPLLSSYDVLCTQEQAWLGGSGGNSAHSIKALNGRVFFVRTRGRKGGNDLQCCVFEDHLLGLINDEFMCKPPALSQTTHSYHDIFKVSRPVVTVDAACVDSPTYSR